MSKKFIKEFRVSYLRLSLGDSIESIVMGLWGEFLRFLASEGEEIDIRRIVSCAYVSLAWEAVVVFEY